MRRTNLPIWGTAMNVSLKQLYFMALDRKDDELANAIIDYITNIIMGGDMSEWDDEYNTIKLME